MIRAAHWSLVAISIGTEIRIISLYDFLGPPDASIGSLIKRWLVDEATGKGMPRRKWNFDSPECSHEENADDCAVFTLKNMDYIARGLDVLGMKRSTAYYRCRIAAELLAAYVGRVG